ncbi:MAG: hypothetical protein ABI390_08060 [Daejeonella sp.]
MKKLFLLSLTAIIVLLSQSDVKAQQTYEHALGGRLGTANGITYKTFIEADRALDFILNFQSKNDVSRFRFTGLYEIHNQINNAPGLRWYYGGGGTVGSYKRKNYDGQFLASLDGVLGLDYKFDEVPINVALDWKPALEIVPNTGFDAEGFGLSIRFTF